MSDTEQNSAWMLYRLHTSSGESWIDFRQVCAIVCHLPNRENFNIDVHMNNGSIFTVIDTNHAHRKEIMNAWKNIIQAEGNE